LAVITFKVVAQVFHFLSPKTFPPVKAPANPFSKQENTRSNLSKPAQPERNPKQTLRQNTTRKTASK
jgi:hypothetical protein